MKYTDSSPSVPRSSVPRLRISQLIAVRCLAAFLDRLPGFCSVLGFPRSAGGSQPASSHLARVLSPRSACSRAEPALTREARVARGRSTEAPDSLPAAGQARPSVGGPSPRSRQDGALRGGARARPQPTRRNLLEGRQQRHQAWYRGRTQRRATAVEKQAPQGRSKAH